MNTRLLLLLSGLLIACEEKDRVEGTEPGDCTDGADNDGDGLFDCDDDGCTGSPDCSDEDTEDVSDSDDGDDSDTTDTDDDDTDDDDTDDDDTDDDDTTVESPNWTGVWRVDMNLNFSCDHSLGGTTADEDNDQQTIMLQLSGPPNDLYAVTPGTDSSWSMSGSGDDNGIFLGGSIRMEVDGDPIDWDSNVTIAASDIISANEVHGTIFGSFSANSGWWECEFKDEPSTVVLTQ